MRKKKNPIFYQIVVECKAKGIAHLMGYKHGWNKEIIAQFYATVHFSK